jgi:HAD superfamily hydrolase (TIGR01484 family)
MRGSRPIAELDRAIAASVRFVLFDIDDTITEGGLLPEASYSAMWAMRRAGIAAVPVTGRPAGWCDLIARQWPVSGVVGENGAFAFYMKDGGLRRLFHPAAPSPDGSRVRLARLGERATAAIPGLRLAKDQDYRLFDLALDFAEEPPVLPLEAARAAKEICEAEGARAKISSIHVNAWFGDYDKLSMSERFLSEILGWDAAEEPRAAIFIGDSPNDEPMFERFPLSCAVANIRRFEGLIKHSPAFVAEKAYGEGFAEVCSILLNAHALA